MSKFKIETPHAAVVIFNYKERLSYDMSSSATVDEVENIFIATRQCVSIETSKSKGQPQGSFRLVLAPGTNWVSAITPGSWCCILMSNDKISKEDLQSSSSKNKSRTIKMIGRIETVRVSTQATETGARRTLYYVSGVDWGNIFNSILYIDPNIAAAKDQGTQGNAVYVALRNLIYTEKGERNHLTPDAVINSLLRIFGSNVSFNAAAKEVGALGKSVYDYKLPTKLMQFLGFSSQTVTSNIKLKSGALSGYNKYRPVIESLTMFNPITLQGQHTLWQIMMDNCNPALNEMYCEIEWDAATGDRPNLTLYKRIRPFSGDSKGKYSSSDADVIRSSFQNVKFHDIDSVKVTSVNAGTNWRDKYNYVELKFNTQDFRLLENQTKKNTQDWDEVAFSREGFRPMIESTRQFPIKPTEDVSKVAAMKLEVSLVKAWVSLLREWYFDTHRMLNGTLTMQGSTEYIGVGNNIKFDLELINPSKNINSTTVNNKSSDYSVLAHVENVSHSFSVDPNNGARTYSTTIQFTRGVIVNRASASLASGSSTLDSDASKVSSTNDQNTKDTVIKTDKQDPYFK